MAAEDDNIEDKETEEKFKRIKEKQEAHMIDIANELLDQESKERIDEKIRKVFSMNSIPFNTMTLSAFYEGITLGMAAYSQDKDGQVPFMILAYTKTLINQKKKEVSEAADSAMKGGLQDAGK